MTDKNIKSLQSSQTNSRGTLVMTKNPSSTHMKNLQGVLEKWETGGEKKWPTIEEMVKTSI